MRQPFLPRQDVKVLSTFINILQKHGNKQKALKYILNLFTELKQKAAGFTSSEKYPIERLDDNNPIQLIHKCLENLKPAFALRRIMIAGKIYELPVPITEKRSMFMAFNWIRKTILSQNKGYTSFTTLLTNEITSLVFNEGSTKTYLKDYIDLAIDQKPFERFVRRRRIVKVHSRGTRVAKKFSKIFKKLQKRSSTRWFKSRRRIKIFSNHDVRSKLIKTIKTKKRKYNKKGHKKYQK